MEDFYYFYYEVKTYPDMVVKGKYKKFDDAIKVKRQLIKTGVACRVYNQDGLWVG